MNRLVRFEFLEGNKPVHVIYKEVYSKEDFEKTEIEIKEKAPYYTKYYATVVEEITFENCDVKDYF